MTPQPVHLYESALMLLAAELPSWIPGVEVHRTSLDTPLYAHFNDFGVSQSPTLYSCGSLVITNKELTATLGLSPIAVFERGEILARVAFLGTLRTSMAAIASEALVLRDKPLPLQWVALGAERLPTGRYPTLPLRDALERVL